MSIKSLMLRGFESTAEFVSKNAPAILTGFAIVGTISTAVLTAYATVKSQNDIYDRDEEDGFLETATKKDIIKMCWPNYIPAIITGTVTIGCILGSQHINHRRQIALAAAYELADTALTEYKAKVVEQIGKNKEAKIQAAVDKDRIEKNPPSEELVKEVCDIRLSDMLFYDQHAGYFASNPDKIKTAAHKANDYMHKDRVSVADFIWDCGCKKITDDCYDYYFDDNESGEICVEDLVTYNEEELYGRTFVVGTLHYNAVDRRRYMF